MRFDEDGNLIIHTGLEGKKQLDKAFENFYKEELKRSKKSPKPKKPQHQKKHGDQPTTQKWLNQYNNSKSINSMKPNEPLKEQGNFNPFDNGNKEVTKKKEILDTDILNVTMSGREVENRRTGKIDYEVIARDYKNKKHIFRVTIKEGHSKRKDSIFGAREKIDTMLAQKHQELKDTLNKEKDGTK